MSIQTKSIVHCWYLRLWINDFCTNIN